MDTEMEMGTTLPNRDTNLELDIEDLAKLEQHMEPEPPKANPVSRQNLEWYYDKLFPFKQFYKWLGLNNSDVFERREFSFTLENDIYCRFQSFKSEEEFRKETMRGLPIKIDIGAIYNTPPKYHNSVFSRGVGNQSAFTPVQKEMVFDIDMTDYDDVRTCCKDANICDKCWKFMVIAYKILNAILLEDFGFENTQWIFSGRRGIHCWVSDERARNLSNDGRSAIANYIKFKIVNQNTGAKVALKEPIHPSVERSLHIIESCFEEYILKGQDVLNETSGKINALVLMIIKAHFLHIKDFDSYETKIKSILDDRRFDSVTKWNAIYQDLLTLENKSGTKINLKNKYTMTELCLKEIKLNFVYPRLDINVSKHINHLLKSPFCVHPKTGLISVPLNEDDIINFSLDKIPSIIESIDDFMEEK